MSTIYPNDRLEYLKPIKLIGNNKIWLNSLFITGPGYYFIFISYFSLTIPVVILAYNIVITYTIISKHKILILLFTFILYCIVCYLLITSGCTDPGILSRKINNRIKEKFDYDYKTDYKLINKGKSIKYNLCYTCNIVRPSRTSHCAECDNCTERFDHHCIWIGQCVGKRNYRNFILFLIFLNIFAVMQLIINCVILAKESYFYSFIKENNNNILLYYNTLNSIDNTFNSIPLYYNGNNADTIDKILDIMKFYFDESIDDEDIIIKKINDEVSFEIKYLNVLDNILPFNYPLNSNNTNFFYDYIKNNTSIQTIDTNFSSSNNIGQTLENTENNLVKIIVLFCFNIVFVLLFKSMFITKLMIEHVLLACKNVTFYENIKKKFNKINTPLGNPYCYSSYYKNFKKLVFCLVPKGSLNIKKIWYYPLQEINKTSRWSNNYINNKNNNNTSSFKLDNNQQIFDGSEKNDFKISSIKNKNDYSYNLNNKYYDINELNCNKNYNTKYNNDIGKTL